MDEETQNAILEINKSLKALVNLMKFEMQNKYIEKLQEQGIQSGSDELSMRVDGYET